MWFFGLSQDKEKVIKEKIEFGFSGINDEVFIYAPFDNFGSIQQELENKCINVLSSEFERIPINTIELDKLKKEEVSQLINLIEEDNDVLSVFSNLK